MLMGLTGISYFLARGQSPAEFDPTPFVDSFGTVVAVVIFLSVMATNTMAVYGMTTSAVTSHAAKHLGLRFLPTALMLGLISIIGATWMALLDAFADFLALIGAFFIPVFAIVIVDYLFIRRGSYGRELLLSSGGTYWFRGGVNWTAMAVWVLGAAASYLLGYVWIPPVIGSAVPVFLLSAALYLALSWHRRRSGAPAAEELEEVAPMREDLAERLIHALQQDGRTSYNDLAAQLDAPRNLVSATVRQLLETGQIRVVATAANAATGAHVLAHVALRCSPHATELITRLQEQEDITLVSAVSGDHDVVAEIRSLISPPCMRRCAASAPMRRSPPRRSRSITGWPRAPSAPTPPATARWTAPISPDRTAARGRTPQLQRPGLTGPPLPHRRARPGPPDAGGRAAAHQCADPAHPAERTHQGGRGPESLRRG